MTEKIGKMSKKQLFLVALGALGVVFGDIGTSPLYALNEIVRHLGAENIALNPIYILGPVSLIIWSLTLVVTIKYISIILNADNNGEGGVFALLSKIMNYEGKVPFVLGALLILSAGLLFGDGIITPAISVLSAVEGLKVIMPELDHYILPITVLILTVLFAVQKNGTSKVGIVFGPIIGLWFFSLAGIGIFHLSHNTEILRALNPYYAFVFMKDISFQMVLVTVGLVMLAVTGGEALYADMGHFGKKPIKLSWFSLVYPALILNYLGQGAYLLGGNKIIAENLFFSTVPVGFEVFMLILATCATIIASQALISGAFSIAYAGINLNLLPRLPVKFTHEEHQGQIYIPFVNWGLYLGCIFLVFSFKTSSNLASAYGLAVAACMTIDSICMFFVTKKEWKWTWIKILLIFTPLLVMDLSFLTANSLKFLKGGYVPSLIGVSIFIIMTTWQWGRRKISLHYKEIPKITVKDLIDIKKSGVNLIDKTYVIMAPDFIRSTDKMVPALMQTFLDKFTRLPKHIIFMSVNQENVPYATDSRYQIETLEKDDDHGSIVSVQVNFGFMEDQNVEGILDELAEHNLIEIDHNPSTWLVRIMQDRALLVENANLFNRLRFALFNFLNRNSRSFDEYFGLAKVGSLTSEIIPVILGE